MGVWVRALNAVRDAPTPRESLLTGPTHVHRDHVIAAVQAEIVGVVLNKAKHSAAETYTYLQAEVVS